MTHHDATVTPIRPPQDSIKHDRHICPQCAALNPKVIERRRDQTGLQCWKCFHAWGWIA